VDRAPDGRYWIAVRVGADHFTLPTDLARRIGLIVNEFVTNVFWYAFAEGQEGIDCH
jgi:two-component sensor histidine kinase